MNRSFRAQDSLMPSIRPRVPQLRSLKEPTMKEKEDDLALFLEMRKREKEKNDLLLHNSEELDDSALQSGISPLFNIPLAAPVRKTVADEFLNSENDKNDYDWLLTPPGTPLFPYLDMESRKAYIGETEAPNARPTALKSRLANSQPEATNTIRSGLASRQGNTSSGGVRRPSSSGGMSSRPVTPSGSSGSRPATPTGRPSLTTTSSRGSRSSTPTSRPTLSSTKPAMTASTRPTAFLASNRSSSSSHKSTAVPRSSTPSRSSTPTARSSTPTSRSTARSSTPTTTRPTSTVSSAPRSSSRQSTPTRRPSTPSRATTTTAAAASLTKSTSLVNKAGSAAAAPSKSLGPSRPASPSVRPRPWKPSEMPGFSLDAPPNLRTTLPDRPLSATRGRPGAPTARSASVEPATTPGRHRRQSCSPSRGRAPSGSSSSHMSGSSVPAVNRLYARANEEISPVAMGNKMVERVVNMRKLAPPRQDDKHSPSLSGKSASSPDSTGFGRTLSKKSLDMAIRHMDIRRTIPGNLRPLMTNIPASSMYSVRSGPARSRTISVSDSPLATSSNASSELSVTNTNAVGISDVHETEHINHGFSR